MKKKKELVVIFCFAWICSILFSRVSVIAAVEQDVPEYFTGVKRESEVDKSDPVVIQLMQEIDKLESEYIEKMVSLNLNTKDIATPTPTLIPSLNDIDTKDMAIPTLIPLSDTTNFEITDNINLTTISVHADYIQQVYTDENRFYYYNNEEVAVSSKQAIIFKYTDGKVHLYDRVTHVVGIGSFGASYPTYGEIKNTDGSYSCTFADQVIYTNGSHRVSYIYDYWMNQSYYGFEYYKNSVR